MRYTLIVVIFSTLLITSKGSLAGGSQSYSFGFGYSHNTGYGARHAYGGKYPMRYGYGSRFGYGHSPGHHYRHGKHHRFRHYPASSFRYSYRYHSGYGSGAEIVGALLLGGVIGYGFNNVRQNHSYRTYYNSYYRDSYHLNSRSIVYPGSSREPDSTSYSGRRLYKDRNGDCSEIVRNNIGDELRIQLDQSECDW